MDEVSIFTAALEKKSSQQREAFLAEACGDDPQLRAEVEGLLAAHAGAGEFLQQPPAGLLATIVTGNSDTVDESLGEISLDFLTPTEKPNCLGVLGQYEVVEVVGRGGMGLVLRAYDTKLNRVVAIKVLAPSLAANPMAVKRFLREAKAAASVSHDHVVTIHAIEEAQIPPAIVMEFVDGLSLHEKIERTGGLELKEILRIGMQIARGLAAAHQQGLVHRDIKPANILLENGVERVKITDFGLARATDDVSVTQTGQIAGTPQFMSPEQAQGHAIDARSDLFSLGSVLYAMCTGRAPFRAETPLAMLRRVCDDQPRSICEINSDMPDWLEAIAFKLLAKEPAERFQSADEVADLLGKHLAHLQHPTTAPKPPRVEASVKPPASNIDEEFAFVETTLRVYGWIALMWATMAILFAAIVLSFPGNYTATYFTLNAPWAMGTGMLSLITGFLAFSGLWHVRRRESYRRAMLGCFAATLPVNPPLLFAIGWAIASLIKLRQPKVRRAFAPQKKLSSVWPIIEAGAAIVGCLALFLAAAVIIYVQTNNGVLVIESDDENIEIMITRPTTDTHDKLQVRVVDRVTGSEVVRLPSGHYRLMLMKGPEANENIEVSAFRLSKEQFVLKRGEKVIVRLTRRENIAENAPDELEELVRLEGHEKYVLNVDFAPDGWQIVTGSGNPDNRVIVWDSQNGRRLRQFTGHKRSIHDVKFSPNGKYIASAGKSGEIILCDAGTLNEVRRLKGHTGYVTRIAFSSDSRLLASGSNNWNVKDGDVSVRVWNVETGDEVWMHEFAQEEIQGQARPGGQVWEVQFSPNGKQLLTAHQSPLAQLTIWDAETGEQIRRFGGTGPQVSNARCAAWSPNGDLVATGHAAVAMRRNQWHDPEHCVIRLYDADTGDEIRKLTGHTGPIDTIDFSPNGELLASGSGGQYLNDKFYEAAAGDNSVRLWDVETGRELLTKKMRLAVKCVRFSNDGKKLATSAGAVGDKPDVRIWGMPAMTELLKAPAAAQFADSEMREVGRFEGHSDYIDGIAYSPGSRFVVTGGADGAVRVWDANTQSEVSKAEGLGPVDAVAVSPDESIVAAAAQGRRQIFLIELATGRVVREFGPKGRKTHSLAFSLDGGRLLSGDYAGSAVLWDVESGEAIRELIKDGPPVESVGFSRNGRLAFAADYDGTIRLWSAREWNLSQTITGAGREAALSSDGGLLVASGGALYDTDNGKRVKTFDIADFVSDVHFTPDDRHIIVCQWSNLLRIIDAVTGNEVARAKSPTHGINEAAISPDGRFLATGGGWFWKDKVVRTGDNTARLWRLPESVVARPEESAASPLIETNTAERLFTGQNAAGFSIALSADGAQALVGHGDSEVSLWDVGSGKQIKQFTGAGGTCHRVVFWPDGKHAAASSEDGNVYLWDLETEKVVRTFGGHTGRVDCMALSRDGLLLLTGAADFDNQQDRSVRLWNAATGKELRRFAEELMYVRDVVFSIDGRHAYGAGAGTTSIIQWDVATGAAVHRFPNSPTTPLDLALSPDGRWLAAGYMGNVRTRGQWDDQVNCVVRIWDLQSREVARELRGHTGPVGNLTFTPDGRFLLTAATSEHDRLGEFVRSGDQTVRLWEVSTGREAARYHTQERVNQLAATPEGRSFVTVGDSIRLWRLPESASSASTDATHRAEQLGMKFAQIPAGEFLMGSTEEEAAQALPDDGWFFANLVPGRRRAEMPQHRVTITRPFDMSIHEVTIGQFNEFVKATGYKTTAEQQGAGVGWVGGEWMDRPQFNWRNPGFSQADDHPVCNVSWEDARAFCRWLSERAGRTCRLPTEAEWEYACRAGSTTRFSSGDEFDSLRGAANLADKTLRDAQPHTGWAVDWEDGFVATSPVGSFAPNAFGIYDMHGNAWEWCQDIYDRDWYETSPVDDPVRFGSSGPHVFRGGGFDNWPGFLRSADRYSSHSEELRTDWAGFRVVREVAGEK